MGSKRYDKSSFSGAAERLPDRSVKPLQRWLVSSQSLKRIAGTMLLPGFMLTAPGND